VLESKERLLLIALLTLPLLVACRSRDAEDAFGFVQGDYAYVPHGQQVVVMDVRRPEAPREVARWDAPGRVRKVVVHGRYAYVVHYPSAESWDSETGPPDGGVQIVDVGDPLQPEELGIYHAPNLAADVAVLGDVAYVADWAGLRVVDVSCPDAPAPVANLIEGTRAVHVSGEHLYASWGYCAYRTGDCGGGLWLADVTSPQAPVELGLYQSDDLPAYDVAVAGDYAYVAGKGVWLLDVADPARPALAAYYDVWGGYYHAQVELAGSHLFLVAGGLHVFDVAQAPELREIAHLQLGRMHVMDMALRDGYLYVAADKGLDVIDVRDPGNPLLIGSTHAAPVRPPQPSPTPQTAACGRFGPLESRLSAAVHRPAVPDPPLPTPQPHGTFAHAVHTLFLDETVARLATGVGFDTVVQVFPWRDLNPAPGLYAWEASDHMVRVAHAHGLNLVVRLDMPPDWARATGRGEGMPFDLGAYADFVSAVAERYRGHVLGYVVWNEPNLAAEWSHSGGDLERHWSTYSGWVADPADYVGVLGVACRRIRAADPAALVVAAGLAPTNENSPRARDDRDFLREMLAAGAADCFDVLAVHAYGYGLDPGTDRATHDGLNLARVLDVRDVMQAQGVDKPVWITELGYTVDGGQHPSVTAAQQGDYLASALTRARQEWPWVEMVTVWNLAYGRAPGDEMAGYSLVAPDLTPRPAYRRLQAVLESARCPAEERASAAGREGK